MEEGGGWAGQGTGIAAGACPNTVAAGGWGDIPEGDLQRARRRRTLIGTQ